MKSEELMLMCLLKGHITDKERNELTINFIYEKVIKLKRIYTTFRETHKGSYLQIYLQCVPKNQIIYNKLKCLQHVTSPADTIIMMVGELNESYLNIIRDNILYKTHRAEFERELQHCRDFHEKIT